MPAFESSPRGAGLASHDGRPCAQNLVRGRGLLCRSIMKSQMASPPFTNIYAALVAVVNTKFPEIGELLLTRVVLQFRRAYKRNDKPICIAASKFLAHLVNQQARMPGKYPCLGSTTNFTFAGIERTHLHACQRQGQPLSEVVRVTSCSPVKMETPYTTLEGGLARNSTIRGICRATSQLSHGVVERMPDPAVPAAQVAHEALALEVIFLLLETPSADSVEVAVAFVKEVGAFLQDISPQALNRCAPTG